MLIGAVYPQTELGGDPASLARISQAVEELGYDHLLMYDHVVGIPAGGREPPAVSRYNDTDSFHDPLTAFAYVAGLTRRIGLVTGVLVLPQRQTVLVAKQATDVDLVSGGRLQLGVGTGVNYVEFDALGQDFSTRGPRLTEQIQYLRRLWSEPLMSFAGDFDKLDNACINPRPRRQIPIYCGGASEPMYRRAAKLADGFIYAFDPSGLALDGWSRTQALLCKAQRSITAFKAFVLLQDTSIRGLDIPAAIEAVCRWQDAGGTHASVVTMGRGYDTADRHIEHFAELAGRITSRIS